jgi:8-oxo-dGTP pyrophosphatase MutT (NUDIX family)
MSEIAPPKPASTIVLLREGTLAPEIYMVKRASQAAFFGGAYVFPGGKVDAADSDPRVLSRVRGLTTESAARMQVSEEQCKALCVAALRETFEESNLLLAVERGGAPANLRPQKNLLQEARKKLNANDAKVFPALLDELDLYLDVSQIVFFARWVTPEAEPKRFDASFFLAHAPAHQEAIHDDSETTDGVWLSAAQIIAKHNEKEIFLAPPTFRTIENLLPFSTINSLIAHYQTLTPAIVKPFLRFVDDGIELLLDHDPEHPSPCAGPFVEGQSRIVLHEGRWWSKPAGNG